LVARLEADGIQVQTFGRGWNCGYVSTTGMVELYNASAINLCFMKTYDQSKRPQIKNKLFDICMSGGFLLCEYVAGIEEYFEVDKELVCFESIHEATSKIRYYLDHEDERQSIAQAGWERAQREHSQLSWLSRAFDVIEQDVRSDKRRVIDSSGLRDMPWHARRLPSSFHRRWAKVLMLERYDMHRWQEELGLALYYDPESVGARCLSAIGNLPSITHPGLIRVWSVANRLRRYCVLVRARPPV